MITYFIALILGILFWTFLEYVIHRFLLHKKGANNPVSEEHLRHHRQGNYFAPFWKKLVASVMALVICSLIVGLAVDFVHCILFSSGIAGMYLIYEITHKRLHARAPLIGYGMIIRKHHFYHHFGNPKMNHGVTVRFWDRLFGTFQPTLKETVCVPRKMVLPWLVDNDGNAIARFQHHFSVR